MTHRLVLAAAGVLVRPADQAAVQVVGRASGEVFYDGPAVSEPVFAGPAPAELLVVRETPPGA